MESSESTEESAHDVASGYRVHVHRKTGSSEYSLRSGEEMVFGRDPDCTVSLPDGKVSRTHAVLKLRARPRKRTAHGDHHQDEEEAPELVFEDLGSRNGSIVDGVRVEANVPTAIRSTSVIRIGGAVVVLEEERVDRHSLASAAASSPWCFDASTFQVRAKELLNKNVKPPASRSASPAHVHAFIDVRWGSGDIDSQRTTTGNTSIPSRSLAQALPRIVGPHGLIGAHDTRRLLIVVPDTDRTRLEESAALVKRLCDQDRISAEVWMASVTAASGLPLDSLDSLLARQAMRVGMGSATLIPPVIFQGSLRSVDGLLEKLEASEAPVLIVGETGVGKDVLARTLHARSRRADRPFVALNCAAFAEALFESELFGHERGAFTGAAQAKIGLLESASGGTVFLDEIGEMPLGLQAKMLRVVENREVLRVGALKPKEIDVRFIFATNRDLQKEIAEKSFRSDLFFRIATVTLTIPPLRQRTAEIVPLARHFVEQTSKRLGRTTPPRLLSETERFLEGHTWPGNVRELKNVIDLATLVVDGDVLRPADVHIDRYVPADSTAASAAPAFAPAHAHAPDLAPSAAVEKHGASASMTERERILDALERSLWNQSSAAKLLGMPRRTFVKRLAQYDLPRPRKMRGGDDGNED